MNSQRIEAAAERLMGADRSLAKAAAALRTLLGLSNSVFKAGTQGAWLLMDGGTVPDYRSVVSKLKSKGAEIYKSGRPALRKNAGDYEMDYTIEAYFNLEDENDPLFDVTVHFSPNTLSIFIETGRS